MRLIGGGHPKGKAPPMSSAGQDPSVTGDTDDSGEEFEPVLTFWKTTN